MELPIDDRELQHIILSLAPGSELRARLELVYKVRRDNPGGPWKAILREQGVSI